MDGEPVTIVGVMPATFQILFPADLWTVYAPGRGPEQRQMHYLQVVGRLKPGVTREQANADMAGIAAHIAAISPATNKGWGVTIEPLRDALVGSDLKTTSLVLGGIVGFVLLMACANVANLLLARGVGRTREIAVRAALGGGRGRILRQLVTESLLLAAIGGVAGLALSAAAIRLAPSFMPAGTLPPGIALALDSARRRVRRPADPVHRRRCPASRPPGTPARCRCRRRSQRAAARPRAARGWSARRSPSWRWLSRWCCWPAPGC